MLEFEHPITRESLKFYCKPPKEFDVFNNFNFDEFIKQEKETSEKFIQ
ncbi:hypothetical protein NW064_06865 [Mycoplasmopsis felis]|nr:hypothetical protein [Mycoplasmopsis felis]UWW00848.1 hypothetical protein NW064_06865 [Mycoplasmopsis felis]